MNRDCECSEFPCTECGHCNFPEWISIEDRLPEKGVDVLIYSKERIFHAFWDCSSSLSGDWYDIQNNWIIEDVTHWMPLPTPPKEKYEMDKSQT